MSLITKLIRDFSRSFAQFLVFYRSSSCSLKTDAERGGPDYLGDTNSSFFKLIYGIWFRLEPIKFGDSLA